MTRSELFEQIQKKQSYLCIGLDTDAAKIPRHLLAFDDPVFEFNKQIIDATSEYCVAYKANLAFYEFLGPKGLQSLEKTIGHIPKNCFTIADAKRGDIGNTSLMYAKTFFEYYHFDSVTVAPYMGKDSVLPFLDFQDKWVILLALTSNEGANDFQKSEMKNPTSGLRTLFGDVLTLSLEWGNANNMMYVVGATQSDLFSQVRKVVPEHFLLVPGVGAQGGSLADVSRHGMNSECGLLVNSSRQIIYASNKDDFADQARIEAKKVHVEMKKYLTDFLQ